MSNKLIFNNYLLILKSTVEVFIHGTLESSNSDVREVLNYGLDTILECQNNTYNEMTNNNWYSINNVDTSSIKKVINCME